MLHGDEHSLVTGSVGANSQGRSEATALKPGVKDIRGRGKEKKIKFVHRLLFLEALSYLCMRP
jgi:hypothetical protein